MRRLILLLALATACGKTRQGGVEAIVGLSGFQPACIEVVVTDVSDASKTARTTVTVTELRTHSIAIGPGEGWGLFWSVSVLGHEGTCTGKVVATDEEPRVEVVPGTVKEVAFTLTATDADTDGWVTDCDDGDPMRNPGMSESCTDGVDNDCDLAIDCADSFCATSDCNDFSSCTTQDRCVGTACVGTMIACGASALPCRAAGACLGDAGCVWPPATPGTPCDGGLCDNSGNCGPPDRELNCADGIDDPSDRDNLVDCRDPDCVSTAADCDAGPCVLGATCQSNMTCAGMTKQCPATGSCVDAGSCNATTGQCENRNSPAGATCSDGNACTDESCNGMGQCAATPRVCPSGTSCQQADCDAGGCFLRPLNGMGCNDGMSCSFGDTCSNGTCTGTSYMCGTPPICRQPGACLGDGGCSFAVAGDGAACDGGWGRCTSGNCVQVPTSSFPYQPSNFDPGQYPSDAAVVINCPMTFDSTDGGASGWCGGPAPVISTVTMLGGTRATLISARSLSVTSAGIMRLTGARPVIIAVHSTGQTLIDGDLLAFSDRNQTRGAGARDLTACGAQAGGSSTAADHSGGGAGYGTAGAAGVSTNGGAAGVAGPTTPVPLAGGCPGGDTLGGTQGGAGGGALQISVAGELKLGAGVISVSGGGGRGGASGGTPANAGGGGGSGGVLLLEGNLLDLTSSAALTSNGGAGGEGGDSNEIGNSGMNGSQTDDVFVGSGSNANNGGNGGRGGTRNGGPEQGASGSSSNGGSGGAVGRIFVRGVNGCMRAIPTGQLSPQYTVFGGVCPASP